MYPQFSSHLSALLLSRPRLPHIPRHPRRVEDTRLAFDPLKPRWVISRLDGKATCNRVPISIHRSTSSRRVAPSSKIETVQPGRTVTSPQVPHEHPKAMCGFKCPLLYLCNL